MLTHHGHTLIIEDNDGQLHRCAARQNLGRLACGDRVVWQLSSVGDGVVVAIGERRSLPVSYTHLDVYKRQAVR